MRKHYIDNIRWMTVVLVVLYHVIYMYNGILTDGVLGPFHEVQYQDAVQYLLYPWFMVILFIVSGMSARYDLERRTSREFLVNRTRKLLVPSTIGLFIFQWIQGYFNMKISGAFETMSADVPRIVLYPMMAISGTGVLWYIQMLWLFSVGLLLIRRFETGKLYRLCERANLPVLLGLGILVWASAQVLNTPIIVVYRFGIYTFCFLLGYFVFANETVVTRLSRYWQILVPAALVLGCGYTYYYFGERYAEVPVLNSPFSIAYGWMAILAIFAVMKRFGDRTSVFASWMTKQSFGLYVFHYLALSAVAYGLKSYTELSALPSYLISGVAAFAGGILLYEIVSRIPLLRWCVLGIKKEKKHKGL